MTAPDCTHPLLAEFYRARLHHAPEAAFRRLADLAQLHTLATKCPEAAPILMRLRGLAGRPGFGAALRRLAV